MAAAVAGGGVPQFALPSQLGTRNGRWAGHTVGQDILVEREQNARPAVHRVDVLHEVHWRTAVTKPPRGFAKIARMSLCEGDSVPARDPVLLPEKAVAGPELQIYLAQLAAACGN